MCGTWIKRLGSTDSISLVIDQAVGQAAGRERPRRHIQRIAHKVQIRMTGKTCSEGRRNMVRDGTLRHNDPLSGSEVIRP